MKTPISRLIAEALAGELPPLFLDGGDREYGQKTALQREAQRSIYSQIDATFRPQEPGD